MDATIPYYQIFDAIRSRLGNFLLNRSTSDPSLCVEQVAWFCLPALGIALASVAEAAAANDSLDHAEEANCITSPRRATRQGDNPESPPSVATASTVSCSWISPPTSGHGDEGTMTEPLLEGAAPSSS